MRILCCLLTLTMLNVAAAAEPIVVDNAMLALIEQVEVPALEAGVLHQVGIHEGELVKRGTLLAEIDPIEAALNLDKAKAELAIADAKATNDIKVRYATKAHEVAATEYRRGKESDQKYEKSVSASELDQLRLSADKTALEIDQAKEDRRIDTLTAKLKQAEVRLAERAVERRKILSPLDAMVVEVKRHQGEWVQPGEAVARLVRIDRLRIEAFVKASQLASISTGSPVEWQLDVPGQPPQKIIGKLVFISPEVNPVNELVRVWAEVENPRLELRPGLQGKMTIGTSKK